MSYEYATLYCGDAVGTVRIYEYAVIVKVKVKAVYSS